MGALDALVQPVVARCAGGRRSSGTACWRRSASSEAKLANDPRIIALVDASICRWARGFAEAAIAEYEERFSILSHFWKPYTQNPRTGVGAAARTAIIGGDRTEEATTTIVTVFPGAVGDLGGARTARRGTGMERTDRASPAQTVRPAQATPPLLAGHRSGDIAPIDAPQHPADRHRPDAAAPAIAGTSD